MGSAAARYTIEQLEVGQRYELLRTITADAVDAFAGVSGDLSPLHIDSEFARERGFRGSVAHGMLLGAFVSELVGMYLPGENALLQSVNLKFLAPAYVNDTLKIEASVDQVSLGTGTIVLKVNIQNTETDTTLVRGKVQVGFTQAKDGQ